MKKKAGIPLMLVAVVFLILSCSSEPGIDKGKFTEVDRAARTVRASLASAASYQESRGLAEKLSAEIAGLKDRVRSTREKDLLKAYSDLLQIYDDGLLLWKYKLEFSSFDFVPAGRIYVGQDVEPIVLKYHFTTETHVYQPTRKNWKSIPEDSIRIIWSNADSQLKVVENITNY